MPPTGREGPLLFEQGSPWPVVLMEEHCEAWPAWKRLGLEQKVCVHLDAHFDLSDADIPPDVLARMLAASTPEEIQEFRSDSRMPWGGFHAGNYLLPALLGGTVRHLVWVVPPWMPGQRSLLAWAREELPRWYQVTLDDYASLREISPHRVDGKVLGRALTLCTLEALPTFAEPVLLDIDVDYFLAEDDTLSASPDERMDQTMDRLPGVACVTIARSVRGGYTPVEHRYVGDLLERLARGGSASEERRVAALLRRGDSHRAAGEFEDAVRVYQQAVAGGLYGAAAHCKLALAQAPLGREAESQWHAQLAAECDPEYRPRPLDVGLLHFRRREHEPCVHWLRRAAREDAESADLCLYMEGVIRLHQGSLPEATSCLERLLASSRLRTGERAWVSMLAGRALLLQDRVAEATAALERAVDLDPDVAAYQRSLGSALHRGLRLEAAARHLRRSVTLAPRHLQTLEAHRELVAVYRASGLDMLAQAEQRRLGEKDVTSPSASPPAGLPSRPSPVTVGGAPP